MFDPLKHVNSARQSLSAEKNERELTLADLDAVAGGGATKPAGGKLLQACCNGKHFSQATLHV